MKIGESYGDLTDTLMRKCFTVCIVYFMISQSMTFKGKFILWGWNNTKRFDIVDMILRVCINVYMMYICMGS